MVKRTLELFECDVCGQEGERYSITYPDGQTRLFDRCSKHNLKLEKFRDEPGEWEMRGGKSSFRVASVGEIRAAIRPDGKST